MDSYLETDEIREAVGDIVRVADELRRVADDPRAWKWVILTLHSALQGFMVCALRGGNGLNALNERSANDLLSWWEGDRSGPRPNDYLADFPTLFKRVQRPEKMRFYVHSKSLTVTPEQRRSVLWIHGLRRRFVHFAPMGWFLSTTELPEVVGRCLEVVEDLAIRSGNVAWSLGDEDLSDRVLGALADARATLPALALDKNG